MPAKNLILAIVAGCALAAGIFVANIAREPAEMRSAFVLPTPNQLPEISLRDQFGNPVTRNSFNGQWDLLFFGFTNCPDICPITLQMLSSVRQTLADTGAETLPRIVLVSVDPERDTTDILARYVAYFGEDNLAVTGDLDEITRLTSALGIFFQKAEVDGDNYSVDHSAAVLAINPDAEFAALFSAPHVVADYLNDLPILMTRN